MAVLPFADPHALPIKLDAVTLNRAQGGTTNIDAYDRYLRWRQLLLTDTWDAEHIIDSACDWQRDC